MFNVNKIQNLNFIFLTSQRNLKQRFVALLRKFKVNEEVFFQFCSIFSNILWFLLQGFICEKKQSCIFLASLSFKNKDSILYIQEAECCFFVTFHVVLPVNPPISFAVQKEPGQDQITIHVLFLLQC